MKLYKDDLFAVNESAGATLVLVTDQVACERIILAGSILSQKQGTPLYVVHVSSQSMTTGSFESMEHLFEISKAHDAVMNIFYSDNIMEILEACITKYKAATILTGKPANSRSIVYQLLKQHPEIDFYVLTDKYMIELSPKDLISAHSRISG